MDLSIVLAVRMNQPHESSSLLEHFFSELSKTTTENGKLMTKGQALAKHAIDKALDGDNKMMASVLKFVGSSKPMTTNANVTDTDWKIIERFYRRNKNILSKKSTRNRAERSAS